MSAAGDVSDLVAYHLYIKSPGVGPGSSQPLGVLAAVHARWAHTAVQLPATSRAPRVLQTTQRLPRAAGLS